MVEIYGPESSGKTTLTLQVIAEMQKLGGTAAFIDAEHALDVHYAENSVSTSADLLISQPDTGEQALEITDMLVRSSGVDVVVIDPVAAPLTPKPKSKARWATSRRPAGPPDEQALRKLTANIKRSNTLVIFINQIRMKIGVIFGSPETTTGGNALKFYASVRPISDAPARSRRATKSLARKPAVKVVKNKVAPPFKEAHFIILYGAYIPRRRDHRSAAEANISRQGRAPGTPAGTKIGQGRTNTREFCATTCHGSRDRKQRCAHTSICRPCRRPPPAHRNPAKPDSRHERVAQDRVSCGCCRSASTAVLTRKWTPTARPRRHTPAERPEERILI